MFASDVVAQKISINMMQPVSGRQRGRGRRPPPRQRSHSDEEDEAWNLDDAADPYRMQCGLDLFRSIRMGAIGAFYIVPNQYGWYQLINHFIPQASIGYAIAKVAISQTIFASWINGSTLFIEALTRTGSCSASWKKLCADFLEVMSVGLAIWPLENLIGFLYFKPQTQAILDQVVGFFWNIFLAYVCGRQKKIELMEQELLDSPTLYDAPSGAIETSARNETRPAKPQASTQDMKIADGSPPASGEGAIDQPKEESPGLPPAQTTMAADTAPATRDAAMNQSTCGKDDGDAPYDSESPAA